MPEIYGNTQGIRRSLLQQLEKIYELQTERTQFCSEEMLQALALFTHLTGREAMVYLDRAGHVVTVQVGEHDRVQIPALRIRRSAERLSGIRCIHTHPAGSGRLSGADIQSLKSLRLDAMAAVGVADGAPAFMQVGILDSRISDEDFSVKLFGPFGGGAVPADVIWDEIRAADLRIRAGFKKAHPGIARALLVGVGERPDAEDPLLELSRLADTAGFITVGYLVQSRREPDKTHYFGLGKLRDLVLEIQAQRADIVIFDDELTPSQMRNIQKELGKTEIMDRTSLILDIFSNRASTHEGRLQVDLAKAKYLLPRMTGYWTHMSRMGGGGSGGGGARRGEGETQLEVDRRLLRKRIHDLEKEIEKIKARRDVRRVARERTNIPVVALVGYTNAGKSTLLNHLSGSDVFAEDKLFATLETVSRRVNFGGGDFLLVDTVGFISKLPHDLVDAFRATLEEARYADLLLHVVDASSENLMKEMEVVSQVLSELGAADKPVLIVYNKCDLIAEPVLGNENIAISATTGMGTERLKQAITRQLSAMRTELSVVLPLHAGALISRIYEVGQVLQCDYREDGIHLKAVVPLEDAARLRAAAIK